ncbi:probable serine/threonine-protein kinase DDB_G0292350 isoform X2 [Biomphalaria glabrata]|uniref:Probable serine/threonine-protein kinase DDB_G0292350 isoform X2 n=1 Tax=Biomphalaria glabrata TaxID=6526 RepID=A0A9W2YMG9_BIOGL|nr:probable serine/threonine-protein kinase DDB_G0292350 isoform X2 [Biomphalaria glabrata]
MPSIFCILVKMNSSRTKIEKGRLLEHEEACLRANIVYLKNNLIAKDILLYLYQHCVLSEDDLEELRSVKNCKDQAEGLIFKLYYSRPSDGFNTFMRALKINQSEVYKHLKKQTKPGSSILDKFKLKALGKKKITDVRTCDLSLQDLCRCQLAELINDLERSEDDIDSTQRSLYQIKKIIHIHFSTFRLLEQQLTDLNLIGLLFSMILKNKVTKIKHTSIQICVFLTSLSNVIVEAYIRTGDFSIISKELLSLQDLLLSTTDEVRLKLKKMERNWILILLALVRNPRVDRNTLLTPIWKQIMCHLQISDDLFVSDMSLMISAYLQDEITFVSLVTDRGRPFVNFVESFLTHALDHGKLHSQSNKIKAENIAYLECLSKLALIRRFNCKTIIVSKLSEINELVIQLDHPAIQKAYSNVTNSIFLPKTSNLPKYSTPMKRDQCLISHYNNQSSPDLPKHSTPMRRDKCLASHYNNQSSPGDKYTTVSKNSCMTDLNLNDMRELSRVNDDLQTSSTEMTSLTFADCLAHKEITELKFTEGSSRRGAGETSENDYEMIYEWKEDDDGEIPPYYSDDYNTPTEYSFKTESKTFPRSNQSNLDSGIRTLSRVDLNTSSASQTELETENKKPLLPKRSKKSMALNTVNISENSAKDYQRSLSEEYNSTLNSTALIKDLSDLLVDTQNPIKENISTTIYKGFLRQKNNVTVAVKQWTVPSKEFESEADIMKTLHHPNVVKFFTATRTESKCCIVMEFLCYGSLENYFKSLNDTLKLEEVIHIDLQIVHGMIYLNGKRILHGELNTANILVGSNGVVKIADYGRACILGKEDEIQCFSVDDVQNRTKWYAPEVISEKRYGLNSEVYSFGLIMHQTITQGKCPVPDAREIHKSRKDSWLFTTSKKVAIDVPESYIDLIKQCCNLLPEKRPRFLTLKTDLMKYSPL